MEEAKKKSPLIIGLASIFPQVIGAIVSIIKDKREKREVIKEETQTTGEAIIESVKDVVGGSISSKRILNLGGTGLIITLAINDISLHGLSKLNLGLVVLGVVYSLGMSFITCLSERK